MLVKKKKTHTIEPVVNVNVPGFITEGHSDNYVKGKGKVIPLQVRCGQRVGRGIALIFHDRSTRRG